MSNRVDLNALRDQILSSQAQQLDRPVRPDDKVFVNRDGQIVLGRHLAPGQERQLSEIHPSVFAVSND